MLGHPSCRFLAFVIVPNCGGSGEKRQSCFIEQAVAYAENESFTTASRSDYGKADGSLAENVSLRIGGSTFPKRAELIGEMKLEFSFKGLTYETLTNPTFQEGVRKAYAYGDFDKPFYEFDALAPRTNDCLLIPATASLGMKTLLFAIAFAADKHRMQRRKDPDASPYINHPIALANVLANEGAVEDVVVLAAAVLHDTIEDTETTAPELLAAFGAEIAGVVVEVTDDKTLSKQTRKQAQIDHAADLSHRAKLVKLADKICNVRDVASSPPADWPLERRQDYFDWAKKVVDRMRGAHPELEQLFDKAYRLRP
jgi:GTP diphosphokinase / guanosine-3',5'-bis(diphosphate) 3'-diphosphatase